MRQAFRLGTCASLVLYMLALTHASDSPTEAPTGFDNRTNGFIGQNEFDRARASFEETEGIESRRSTTKRFVRLRCSSR